MPAYSIIKQVKIVDATMALHNYIRHHPSHYDVEFNFVAEDQLYVLPEAFEYLIGHSMMETNQDTIDSEAQDRIGAEGMKVLHEQITNALVSELSESL